MPLKHSGTQITLVKPTFDNDPALVLLLKPDNVKQTVMTNMRNGDVAYKVESKTSTKCHVFRPGTEPPIALIERRDFFPDKITLEGEERQSIKNWLQGYGTVEKFPGGCITGRPIRLDSFLADNSERPIAWFERSKKRVIDGKPAILQAWLAMEPDAIAIQDAVVVSFLVVEHKLRTDIKAEGLLRGRASGARAGTDSRGAQKAFTNLLVPYVL